MVKRYAGWVLALGLLCGAFAAPKLSSRNTLAAAKAQLKNPAKYRNGYEQIKYPNGDIPKGWGSCADVAVRALRGCGLDLQKAIHEDAKRNRYPGMGKLDTNIDHRRVRNQVVYFTRRGWRVKGLDFKPGDFVVWKLPSGYDHIGVVSDRKGASGNPLVIHNIWQVAEEDVLKRWKITGHFRVK
ncbi:MAG: DUF1287 domain-containing protein [Armatimonadetes bacterium]|nr:DUF1287 domain-containing protein [Armatimonadota bacterium]